MPVRRKLNGGYFLREGLACVFRHGFMSFALVFTIFALLLIMGTFFLLAQNVSKIISEVENDNIILAYVNGDYSEAQARALEPLLLAAQSKVYSGAMENVESVSLTQREQHYLDLLGAGYSSVAGYRGLDIADFYKVAEITVIDKTRIEETISAASKVDNVVKITRSYQGSGTLVAFFSSGLTESERRTLRADLMNITVKSEDSTGKQINVRNISDAMESEISLNEGIKLFLRDTYLENGGDETILNDYDFRFKFTITVINDSLIADTRDEVARVNGIAQAKVSETSAGKIIIAYVAESYSATDALALKPAIEALKTGINPEYVLNVSSVKFISREDATIAFLGPDYSSNERYKGITSDTFRDRFEVYVHDVSLMQETQYAVAGVSGIVKVSANIEIARELVKVRNIVSGVSLALIAVLLIVSLFLMSNTIKLATVERREEIAIMRMVGATNSFICWPFVFEGFILGVTGALLAFVGQWAIYDVAVKALLSPSVNNLLTLIPFGLVAPQVCLAFIVIGFLVGAFGSASAIRRYLIV